MKEMSLDLDVGESLKINVGNVGVHIWREGDKLLSISTATSANVDDIQVEVDTDTGAINGIKHRHMRALSW
jgi:hypothetical protein